QWVEGGIGPELPTLLCRLGGSGLVSAAEQGCIRLLSLDVRRRCGEKRRDPQPKDQLGLHEGARFRVPQENNTVLSGAKRRSARRTCGAHCDWVCRQGPLLHSDVCTPAVGCLKMQTIL